MQEREDDEFEPGERKKWRSLVEGGSDRAGPIRISRDAKQIYVRRVAVVVRVSEVALEAHNVLRRWEECHCSCGLRVGSVEVKIDACARAVHPHCSYREMIYQCGVTRNRNPPAIAFQRASVRQRDDLPARRRSGPDAARDDAGVSRHIEFGRLRCAGFQSGARQSRHPRAPSDVQVVATGIVGIDSHPSDGANQELIVAGAFKSASVRGKIRPDERAVVIDLRPLAGGEAIMSCHRVKTPVGNGPGVDVAGDRVKKAAADSSKYRGISYGPMADGVSSTAANHCMLNIGL